MPERDDAFNYNPKLNEWVPVVTLEEFFLGGRLAHRIITDTTKIWVDLFNEMYYIDNPFRIVIKHEIVDELSAFLFVAQRPWYLTGGYGREEIEI